MGIGGCRLERSPRLHGGALLDMYGHDGSGGGGLQLVLHLHRLHDEEGLAFLDLIPGLHEQLHDLAGHGGGQQPSPGACSTTAGQQGAAGIHQGEFIGAVVKHGAVGVGFGIRGLGLVQADLHGAALHENRIAARLQFEDVDGVPLPFPDQRRHAVLVEQFHIFGFFAEDQ